jgi:hypothetical protein
MAPTHENSNWVKRLLHWLFGAPFEELPPEFGDPVPPGLRVLEAEMEESQHHVQEREPSPSSIHSGEKVHPKGRFHGARIRDK